jgi:predicted N-acetyltransferase YhbS
MAERPTSSGLRPGFILRAVVSDEDVERYVGLNESVTKEGAIARRLILHRPGSERGDFLMAAEETSGRAVSTTCLLRWRVSFSGVPLRAAMLEMVVTDPAYRRHGLVRAQIDRFHQRAQEWGADICIIQGIPYYYRQFGYSYALDHSRAIELPARLALEGKGTAALRLRPADGAAHSLLAQAWDKEMSRQTLSVRREGGYWQYLSAHAGLAFQIVERASDGVPLGYVCIQRDAGALRVTESGLLAPEEAPVVLSLLAGMAGETLSVAGNGAQTLFARAEGLGGRIPPHGQWLVRLTDPPGLLARLAPAFEERLRRAGHGTLTTELILNLFRRALRLRFEGGKLAAAEDAGFVDASMGADGGDLCIPPDAFPRLLFGYRALDEIRDAWPDLSVRPRSRPLIEALFPRVESWILMPY